MLAAWCRKGHVPGPVASTFAMDPRQCVCVWMHAWSTHPIPSTGCCFFLANGRSTVAHANQLHQKDQFIYNSQKKGYDSTWSSPLLNFFLLKKIKTTRPSYNNSWFMFHIPYLNFESTHFFFNIPCLLHTEQSTCAGLRRDCASSTFRPSFHLSHGRNFRRGYEGASLLLRR